ncbi:hypothetical protein GCM10017779_31650 [Streptomyces capillispiralis]|uniref:Uncharacterized protein n=1 Tax=Streptomyces capillispiralis TaxID=68182 RepID=A0A561TJQ7_9ACTN|nr:hypothetical protein FHX78_114377 [Streptomyces capillispiralis]GHH92708.1 hypothetical protein GCM10017779_31650 [Streptomyces capillispiralis]
MYHLMVRSSDAPTRLPVILAEVFHVALEQTDVSAGSEYDDRNWDAVVTCEYERLQGDLDWSFSIYAANEVERRPTEAELASSVAQRLSAPVFTAWDARFPWVRGAALPDGSFTLARVLQPEDDSPAYVVDAAESRIPGLPNVLVMQFPESVRAYELPTPITDSVEEAELAKEASDLAGLLRNWERLCSRLSSGFPPHGWFPADLYREDLEYRDRLGEALDRLSPKNTARAARDALEQLDEVYRRFTVDDGGQALSSALGGGITSLPSLPWYWHRRPPRLPWSENTEQEAGPADDGTSTP